MKWFFPLRKQIPYLFAFSLFLFSIHLPASAESRQADSDRGAGSFLGAEDLPSFPVWSLLELSYDEFRYYADEKSGDDHSHDITETEDKVTIKICFPNPEDANKQICIEYIIDKKTGNVTIRVTGYTLLPLTYYIKCRSNGICVIEDDLVWPLGTKFCKTNKNEDGSIVYDCDFDYFGIKFKGKIRIYVEGDKICIQKDNGAPECAPITSIPADLRDLWRRLKPPYLPVLPPDPKPEDPKPEDPCDELPIMCGPDYY